MVKLEYSANIFKKNFKNQILIKIHVYKWCYQKFFFLGFVYHYLPQENPEVISKTVVL